MDYYHQGFDNGQPNAGTGENCGAIHMNGKLHDYPCARPACYICQIEDNPYGNELKNIYNTRTDKRL